MRLGPQALQGGPKGWAGGFPWDAEVERARAERFGVPSFRPQQREAINACLDGRDVFVRMPTGGDGDVNSVSVKMCHESKNVSEAGADSD